MGATDHDLTTPQKGPLGCDAVISGAVFSPSFGLDRISPFEKAVYFANDTFHHPMRHNADLCFQMPVSTPTYQVFRGTTRS